MIIFIVKIFFGQDYVTLNIFCTDKETKTKMKRQHGCLRRPYKELRKEKTRKGKIYSFECRVPKKSKKRWQEYTEELYKKDLPDTE